MSIKRTLLAMVLFASLFIPAQLLACDKGASAEAPALLTFEELKGAMDAEELVLVDVNREEFRSEHGIIPGATLLTSSSSFESTELPESKDAKLVFYCSNERCGASKAAAKRAMELGYKNVGVFQPGLMGWKEAGEKTTKSNT